jgi:hypothetical protein
LSSKLVVEFYESGNDIQPVAAVLAFHGGDEPEPAAITMADFVCQVRMPATSPQASAYELATRFIIWQQTLEGALLAERGPAAILVNPNQPYACQRARLYSDVDEICVEIIPDEFTTTEELDSAELMLSDFKISVKRQSMPRP